jgi:3-methyladenine DNA glycosylase AlkD
MSQPASAEAVLASLRELADPSRLPGMARYGIPTARALGVGLPALRGLARRLGRDHALAEQLWASGVHEARLLASLIDVPGQVTADQLERWAAEFDGWDICDQCCGNLFVRTPFAQAKAIEWSARPAEFVKRAGFVLMAQIAVHDRRAGDDTLLAFLPVIEREAHDDRNYVKKAVNWALRQIGKRNRHLNQAAIEMAQVLRQSDARAARWIAADALRELTGAAVQARLRP